MTSGGLNNDLSENALSDFQRAHEELSVAVSRDLLVLMVFKIDARLKTPGSLRGMGNQSFSRKSAETATRSRVKTYPLNWMPQAWTTLQVLTSVFRHLLIRYLQFPGA